MEGVRVVSRRGAGAPVRRTTAELALGPATGRPRASRFGGHAASRGQDGVTGRDASPPPRPGYFFTSSTRRFWARPASVLFGAFGCEAPKPLVSSRVAATL